MQERTPKLWVLCTKKVFPFSFRPITQKVGENLSNKGKAEKYPQDHFGRQLVNIFDQDFQILYRTRQNKNTASDSNAKFQFEVRSRWKVILVDGEKTSPQSCLHIWPTCCGKFQKMIPASENKSEKSVLWFRGPIDRTLSPSTNLGCNFMWKGRCGAVRILVNILKLKYEMSKK